MSVKSASMSRLVRDLGRALIERYSGKWPIEQYVIDLKVELAKYDLNDSRYRDEIVRSFVRADIATRANVDPFDVDDDGRVQPALFKRAKFRRGVIRLGNKLNVKMSEATSQEWIVRQLHQQEAAAAAHTHAMRTTLFLQTTPGILLMENPRLKTEDAMYQLELWAPGELEDDDEDVADEDL
jgi:hypothetical protein